MLASAVRSARAESPYQFGGIDIERGGDSDKRVERWTAFAQFEVADIRPVDIGDFSKSLLADRRIELQPVRTNALSKLQCQRIADCGSCLACSRHSSESSCRARMGLQKTSRAAKVEAMRRKGLALLTAVVATVGLTGFFVVPGAGASSHPSYPLGKAKSCKAGYSKVTIKKSETVRIKVHGKWKVEHKTIRTVECVYVAPKKSTPTTSTSATTTTTVGHPTSTSTSTTTSTTTTTLTPHLYITPTISFVYNGSVSYTPRDATVVIDTSNLPTPATGDGTRLGTYSFAFSNYYDGTVGATVEASPLQWPTGQADVIFGFQYQDYSESGTLSYSGITYTDSSGEAVTLESTSIPFAMN